MTELSDSPSKSLMGSSSKEKELNGCNKIHDKIGLKLIRVSGQTHVFYFSPSSSAAEISQHVYNNWPEEWSEGRGNDFSVLRLIYQGRFLHGNTTLNGLQLPVGKTTVMHLVSRETVPEPQSADEKTDEKNDSSRCRICCCNIL